MDDNIYPAESVYAEQMQAFRDKEILASCSNCRRNLKKKARAEGL